MKKLLILFSLVTIVSLTSCSEVPTTPTVTNQVTTTEVKQEPKVETKQESKKVEDIKLASGNYIAGTDFPEGVYNITAISGNGNISTSDYELIAMMGTGIDGNDLFQKEFKNAYIKKGVTLKVESVEINLKYVRAKN